MPANAAFYQYAFSPGEIRTLLIKSGFRIEAEYGESSHFALKLRFPFFRKLIDLFPKIRRIDLLLDRIPIVKKIGRMRIYVAKKI